MTEGRRATREDLRDPGLHSTSQTTEPFHIKSSVEPLRRVIRVLVKYRNNKGTA